MLAQVKQVRGFYRVFIIKNKGEWAVCTRGSNHKKRMSNNKADRPGFTASPGKSDTDHAVFQMGT